MKKSILIFAMCLSPMALADPSTEGSTAQQWSPPPQNVPLSQLPVGSALMPATNFGATIEVPAATNWIALTADGQVGQGSMVRGYLSLCYVFFPSAMYPRTLRLSDGFYLASAPVTADSRQSFTVRPINPDTDDLTVNEDITKFECVSFDQDLSARVMTLPELSCVIAPWIGIPAAAARNPYLACPVQKITVVNKPLLGIASGLDTEILTGKESMTLQKFSSYGTQTTNDSGYRDSLFEDSLRDRNPYGVYTWPFGYPGRPESGGLGYNGIDAERAWVNRNFPLPPRLR